MDLSAPPTPFADSVLDCPLDACNFSTKEKLATCPKCGTQLQGAAERRTGGSLLMVFGGLLVFIIGAMILGLVILAVVAFGGMLPSGTRLNNPDMFFLGICIAIIWMFTLLTAGVLFFNAGRYQQQTGERDRTTIKWAIWSITGGLAFMTLAAVVVGS